ncbi:hypothetical protein CANARDRAFT_202541 [[Candida] arabinofermentans NRRL YB-2248]|uniref:TATA-binding protein-associated factor mot1 n=1 Tax=[Candida] arabinofermentans NRRL YB-2248 TaxID=983967 RepID=A0A1E4SW58_9ASCO|nr:hypothetical protein CANARDRAFT_202541 [[Candida] arabinofermentans NRRL YB-2248]
MSRLERLVILLETGSSQFIRNTAADQLSDLAKQHPDEILNLLSRVYPFLKSKKWETRVSAARAFGGIVSHAATWDPNKPYIKSEDEFQSVKKEEDEDLDLRQLIEKTEDHLVSFDEWHLDEILQSGTVLLATSGNEYNVFNGDSNQQADDLAVKKRRTEFTNKLGLHEIGKEQECIDPPVKKEETQIQKQDELRAEPQANTQQSARMRAMAKRKAKFARTGSTKSTHVDLSQSSVSRQLTKDGTIKDEDINNSSGSNTPNVDITSQANGSKLVVEQKIPEISPILQQHAKVAHWVWQFQGVYELLIKDLFNDIWEIRHGATMGLRELAKYQATGAGKIRGKSRQENYEINKRTLEDLCVRLLTLFAMDRFGDYVSDTVVAPVRENAAQTLAALLLNLPEETVMKTFYALCKLVKQDIGELGIKVPCWEAKHGGMLGLRYFVSIRTDLLFTHTELLDYTIDMVLHCLHESGDDDVQSVAASTLIPITTEFVKLKINLVIQIVNVIWQGLTNLKDDLSASIGSVMDLLAKLCAHQEVLEVMKEHAKENETYSFKNLIPRLFPFLRHSITNVRKSVLRTLEAFLKIEDESVKDWVDGKACRLLFQNLLVEQSPSVLQLSMDVYETLIKELSKNGRHTMEDAFKEHYTPLMMLLMTPIGVARFNYSMNTSYILRPSGHTLAASDIPITGYNIDEDQSSRRKRKVPDDSRDTSKNGNLSNQGIPDSEYDTRINIDAPVINGDVTLVGLEVLYRTRLSAATALGKTLSYYQSVDDLIPVFKRLSAFLMDAHSTPRLLAAVVIDEYCNSMHLSKKPIHDSIKSMFVPLFTDTLAEPEQLPAFREFVPTLKGLRTQCLQMLQIFREQGKVSSSKTPALAVLVKGEMEAGPDAFNIEVAEKLINETYAKLMKSMSPAYRMSSMQALEDAKHRISMAIAEAKASESDRSISILSAYASAFVQLNGLPKKLNPVIRSLMDSIKAEQSPLLQARTATSVSSLIVALNASGKNGAADKMIKNLCAFLCVDTSEVPEFIPNKHFTDQLLSLRKEDAETDPAALAAAERDIYSAKIKRRGAKMTLENILKEYKDQLFEKVPRIKSIMFDSLTVFSKGPEVDDTEGQAVIDSLELTRALIGKLDEKLHDIILEKLPDIHQGLKSQYSVFRYSSAKCFATICSTVPTIGFQFMVKNVLPMLSNALEVTERQGAIECVYRLSITMGSDILPYVVFLIVPVLGRMSDANNDVRILATTTFASIIKLVPLEAGIPDPPNMPADLLGGRNKEREFIQQMMDPTKIQPFELPVAIKATLRKYQQEGVNWLYFLNRYHLHGILCDDMGLGKTLQTICIVSSDHHMRAEEFAKTASSESRKLPSLIVCPPSLTGHWEQEFDQYAPFLNVLVYAGSPSIRASLRPKLDKVDVVVTSYDVVRNDIEHVGSVDYNYCVLDEGHIIKNGNTKLTKSVKRIRAEHRLILSGTPIQNNVLELWSLFDFLMPGFLGTEKIFNEKFAKPIALSRSNKGDKEQEAGALALESLHKQVLPFMLRRLKEDVLSDLPPKIIQDYYCELSNLQKQLYKDFIKKQKSSVEQDLKDSTSDEKESKQHIFQALQYMRKLCNHPALVLTPKHPQYTEVMTYLKDYNMDIRDIQHAPKLMSLKNLLLECGIGSTGSLNSKDQLPSEGVISQHRALIFCQMKDMLDMVENDLFKKHMPSVTYMRLDGSTEPRSRQDVVRKFNNDPSIDVLLLTTKVGGLGLNLTGADTVIFVEHDWNPMNDLQAMDRAHRLGQKKVVNVYRLITKDTLEEKIMGLQKFKMNIASTIVNQQNSGLASMDTNQLLDLFDTDTTNNEQIQEVENNDNGDVGGSSANVNRLKDMDVPNEAGLTGKAGSAINELAELWDEAQYEEEYNLDTFIKTLR